MTGMPRLPCVGSSNQWNGSVRQDGRLRFVSAAAKLRMPKDGLLSPIRSTDIGSLTGRSPEQVGDELSLAVRPNLFENRLDMVSHGVRGQDQPLGDLQVRKPLK